MESGIIIQDDWNRPNVQIEIELQPILESTPALADICIQPGSVQTNTANKQIVSSDQVSKKTFCVEFSPKVGLDVQEQQAISNKHLLIEFMPKHNVKSTGHEANKKKNIDSTTDRMKSTSNGFRSFRRNKINCKNNTVISRDGAAANNMIEVDIPAPTMNSFDNVPRKSNKNTEILDPMNENRDVENLLPIYMTAKFKDTEFPSYPVIQKVESLAVVSPYNIEIENAITSVEAQAMQVDNGMPTLWPNQHFEPVLEVNTGNPLPLLNTMVNTRADQCLTFERVEMNCNANKALRSGTRRPESASILEGILKSPMCAALDTQQNQLFIPIQATDKSISKPNKNLVTTVPMVTIEARPPVRTVAPSLPEARAPPVRPMAPSLPEARAPPVRSMAPSLPEVRAPPVRPMAPSLPEARAPPVRPMAPSLPAASRLPEAPPAPTPVLSTDGKSTLQAETYNNLLSRIKILNMSKPLPRPKHNSKIPRRIRREFKDVFKKDCSVSLPRILLYQCKKCSAARTSMFDLTRHLCLAEKTKKKRYQKKLAKTGKNVKEIFYKCGNCFKYYITKQHLMNHILLEHPGVQTLSHTVCYDIADDLYHCNLCDIEFKDEKLLLDHYRATHIVMHKCPFCPSETFLSRDLLVTHFFESHRHVTSLYRCGLSDCFVYFTDYKDLVEHSSLAHGQSILKCILCNTEFPDKDILLQHILTIHNKPKHICEECQLNFPTMNLLLAHKAVPQAERHAADMTRFLLQCRRCARYFIKTIDNKVWPPKNSFLEPILCMSCLIPSETTLTIKSDNNDTVEVLDTD